ncbi:alpha/beta hydrolase family protein [Aerococcus urinae]
MMTIKKLLLLLMTGLLFACGQKPDSTTPKQASQEDQTESKSPQTEQKNETQPASDQATDLDQLTVLSQTEDYVQYELNVMRDGFKIHGKLFLPKGDQESWPLTILAHGINQTDLTTTPYATHLAKRGVAAYVFDFIGGAPLNSSDGDFSDMTVLTELADLEAIYQKLTNYKAIDSSETYLLGDSQGGLVATMMAAKHPEDIQGMILLYPAFNMPSLVHDFVPDKEEIPDSIDIMGVSVSRYYIEDMLKVDVEDITTSYPGPVLIIHGEDDVLVPPVYAQKAAELFPKAHLEMIPGGKHEFSGSDFIKALSYIDKFMVNQLGDEHYQLTIDEEEQADNN